MDFEAGSVLTERVDAVLMEVGLATDSTEPATEISQPARPVFELGPLNAPFLITPSNRPVQ